MNRLGIYMLGLFIGLFALAEVVQSLPNPEAAPEAKPEAAADADPFFFFPFFGRRWFFG